MIEETINQEYLMLFEPDEKNTSSIKISKVIPIEYLNEKTLFKEKSNALLKWAP